MKWLGFERLCSSLSISIVCLILVGCANSGSKSQFRSVTDSHKDYGLYELKVGLILFEHGQYERADEEFAKACSTMATLLGDAAQERKALVLHEEARAYRGLPYERATAFFYRGMCQYQLGKYDGALAAFRYSLASDAETNTDVEAHREDFAISHFMVGLCYLRLGEMDNAREAFQLAARYGPEGSEFVAEELLNRFVMIIATGDGPYLAQGFRSSMLKYACGPSPEERVEVYIDGENLGSATELTDLLQQARSQQAGTASAARGLRDIALTGLAIYAGGDLDPGDVDTRSWEGLPRKFFVFVADPVPADRNLALKFYDEAGEPLEDRDEMWKDVPLRAKVGDILYFRTKDEFKRTAHAKK